MSLWESAQRAERVYHLEQVKGWPSVPERRAESVRLQGFYAGMLGIPLTDVSTTETGGVGDRTVTDFGCGPDSLLLRSSLWSDATAVDPLTFGGADEAAYERAKIRRVFAKAEDYDGPVSDEAWCYNCLQHVEDWAASLRKVCATAYKTVRIFEWVNVETSAVHLHTLRTGELRTVIGSAGFREVFRVNGTAGKVGQWDQDFYAGVWERV